MADAIDVVADVLALVRERDEAREMRDVSQRQADAALAAMHEAARQVEMLRAERDKAVDGQEHAAMSLKEERRRTERAEARLEEVKAALKVLREWNDFERNGLREMRDQVRALVGGDESRPVVDAVRALVEQRDLYFTASEELEAVRAALGSWHHSGQRISDAVRALAARAPLDGGDP